MAARKRTRLRFEIDRSTDGQWFVSIDFGNGNKFAGANGYNTWRNAWASVKSLCENAPHAEVLLHERAGAAPRVLRAAALINTDAVRYP